MAEAKAPEPLEIESRILELCHQFPHGITDQVLQNDLPHMEAQQRASALNRLLSMIGGHKPHRAGGGDPETGADMQMILQLIVHFQQIPWRLWKPCVIQVCVLNSSDLTADNYQLSTPVLERTESFR